MFNLLPPLSGMHVLVVHFPIALLFIAPLFFLVGFVWKSKFELMTKFGGILLVLGAAFTLVATATGDKAEHAVKETPQIESVMHEHEEMAEVTRGIFLALACVFLAAGAISRFSRGFQAFYKPVIGVVFVGHLVGLGFLAKTAHEGGKLVHQLGVHAPMNVADAAAAKAVGEGGENGEGGEKDDD